ncbi:MAG: hypothetical protein KA419_12320 [Acidobacteria bacterium]|nr:hypothetical protein [Acidobacteriota bacterium]
MTRLVGFTLGSCHSLSKAVVICLLLCGVSAFAARKADSPADLFRKCREAEGGKALYKARNGLAEGTALDSHGREGRFSLRTSAPDSFRLALDFGPGSRVLCYNGMSAWRRDGNRSSTVSGEAADCFRLLGLLVNHRWHEPKKSRLAVVPAVTAEPWDGGSTASVQVSLGQARCRLHFDPQTGLLCGAAFKEPPERFSLSLGNYREQDGIREPGKLRLAIGEEEVTLTVVTFDRRSTPDTHAFSFPVSSDGRPLPDLPELVESLGRHQAEMDSRRERYSCRKTVTAWKRDKKGKETQEYTGLYEVTPAGGRLVDRLIAENGRQLTEKRQAEEDRRVEKEMERLAAGRKNEREIEFTASDFLRCCSIDSLRRESWKGRPVLIADFAPRLGHKTRNLVEKLIGGLAGNVWIDEEEAQIIRLEARLTEKFKVGGGLVASLGSCTVLIEQEKINQDAWLPSRIEVDLVARVFLFFGVDTHQVIRYSDYQKVDTRILPGPADPS